VTTAAIEVLFTNLWKGIFSTEPGSSVSPPWWQATVPQRWNICQSKREAITWCKIQYSYTGKRNTCWRQIISKYIIWPIPWTTRQPGFNPWQRQKDFSTSLCVQRSSEAHPASYPMGSEGPSPVGKTQWRQHDADHSPPSSAEVKNEYELYLLSP
jgi:hypothetical protein